MDDCLFKPLTLNDVQRQLDGIFPRTQGEVPKSLLDFSYLRQLAQGDDVAFRSLLVELQQSMASDREELAQWQETGERGTLAELAHRIKGGARLARATQVQRACEEVEGSCRIDSTDLVRAVNALRVAMDQLIEVLNDALEPKA